MSTLKRLAFGLTGLLLLPLGIVGLFIPIIPGIVLLIGAWACFAQAFKKEPPRQLHLTYRGPHRHSQRYDLDYY